MPLTCTSPHPTSASLDKHNRTHTGERPFSCEFCEQRFTEKGPLLRHVASRHQEGRPHFCQICGKTFKGKGQGTDRALAPCSCGAAQPHGGQIECGAATQKLSPSSPAVEQLRVHVRRHKGVRKFECTECGYKFTRQVRAPLLWGPSWSALCQGTCPGRPSLASPLAGSPEAPHGDSRPSGEL